MRNIEKLTSIPIGCTILFCKFLLLSISVGNQPQNAYPAYVKKGSTAGKISILNTGRHRTVVEMIFGEFQKHHREVQATYPHYGRSIEEILPAWTSPSEFLIGPIPLLSDAARNKIAEKNYAIFEISICHEAVVICVNKENPIDEFTFDDIRKIFSGDLNDLNWGAFSQDPTFAQSKIQAFGRFEYAFENYFFRKTAMAGEKFGPLVVNLESNSAIISEVKSNKQGIGYCGVGYSLDVVKTLKINEGNKQAAVAPTDGNIQSRLYPLSNQLRFVVCYHKDEKVSDTLREFVIFLLSKDGQDFLSENGYVRIGAELAGEQVQAIQSDSL